MTDKNINLCDTEDEQLRYNISMLPSLPFLKKGIPEGKTLIKKLTKELSKITRKQKVQVADLFDSLATTQKKGSIESEDIKLEDGELFKHPYESLVRMLGAETSIYLLEHAKIVDDCLSQKFDSKLIIDFKAYLFKTFNYKGEALNINMPAGEFYSFIVLSFIANLDVVVHTNFYSRDIIPISLGWLFMHKRYPNKWEYDTKTEEYNLTRKHGSAFTCTSRSFIHFILTDLYFYSSEKTKQVRKKRKPKEMPKSHYGLRNEINWRTDDEDGQLYSFLDKKSERDSKRNWLSLEDVFWLVGMKDSAKDEPNEVLINWQQSFVKHIKTEDIDDLKGLPPSAEASIWFIYAFFQNIFEQTDKQNKKHNKQSCIIHHDYYDLWESMTAYYESKVSEGIKAERIEWPEYLKKQATRTERMT